MIRVFIVCAVLCMPSFVTSSAQSTASKTTRQSGAMIPTIVTPRYAFAVEASAGEKNPFVVAYSVNPQTGYLRPLESVIPLSDNFGVVVDPSQQFLYLPDGPQIIGYRIAANGTLQALKGSPFNLYGGSTIVFTPNGKFAYSNLGTAFSFNSTTGVFTQIGAVDQGGIHDDVAIDPSGSFLYILDSSTISAFSIDQTTGGLTEIAGSPFASGETHELYSDVVSPDGKFLLVTTAVTSDSGFTGVFSIGATGAGVHPKTETEIMVTVLEKENACHKGRSRLRTRQS